MMRNTLLKGLAAGWAAAAMLIAAQAQGQPYPARPVRLVVPFSAGGATDIAARALAKLLGERLNGAVAVENKPGAGAIIGIDFVAKAEPDGYTLLYGSDSLIINQVIRKKVPYALKDFVPLVRVRHNSIFISANAKAPFNDLRGMVAYAKAHPGRLTYASSGTGTILHMAFEMFKLRAGIHVVHIPYRGSGPAVIDATAGQVDMVVGGIAEMMPFLKNGQLKPVAMTGLKTTPAASMMPAIAESGYPGFHVSNWNGVLAPMGTPDAIVRHLTDVLADIAVSAELMRALEATGNEPNAMLKGEAFAAFLNKGLAEFRSLVETAKLTFED